MYIKPIQMSLKGNPDYSEKWVQKIIAEDPSILGLGDLVLRDSERIQPRAGRLDLLLQDTETLRRFEVELQLGATDETHIIRTLEYWDIERKRYPQYDHCAVIVAENITSRFLNVISLFNGSVPFIAIQMKAMRVGEHLTLVFTTVVDELVRGLVDEDEEAEAAPTDRAYWESKSSKEMLKEADAVLVLLRELEPELRLKYNKFYIGLEKDGQAFNFVQLRPRKSHLIFEARVPESDEIDQLIDGYGFDALDYDKRWGRYRISLKRSSIETHADAIREISKLAYDHRTSG